MPSIVDMIGEAERKAAAIIEQSNTEAKAMVAQAKEQAQAEYTAAQNKCREEAVQRKQRAKLTGENLRSEIMKKAQQEMEGRCAMAKANLPLAVEFIIKGISL